VELDLGAALVMGDGLPEAHLLQELRIVVLAVAVAVRVLLVMEAIAVLQEVTWRS